MERKDALQEVVASNSQGVPSGHALADALESCDWSGMPIGYKAILSSAVLALRTQKPGQLDKPVEWQPLESAGQIKVGPHPVSSVDNEDLMVWPDATMCYRFELGEMTVKSDDYETVRYGTGVYQVSAADVN